MVRKKKTPALPTAEQTVLDAVHREEVERVKSLLSQPSLDINATVRPFPRPEASGEEDSTPLDEGRLYRPFLVAVQSGNLEIVKCFLDESVKSLDINKCDEVSGNSAVLIAVEMKNKELYDLLVERDHVNYDIVNKDGDSAVSLSITNRLEEFAVDLLSERKAVYDFDKSDNETKRTLLGDAAFNGDLESIEFFMKIGWDVNQMNFFGRTAVHESVLSKQMETQKCLIETHNSKSDIEDYSGVLPLDIAVELEWWEGVNFLLEHTENKQELLDGIRYDGRNLLHKALFLGRSDSVVHLLDLGASLNTRDESECTPLMYSVVREDTSLLCVLLEREGIDIFAKNGNGENVVHRAAYWGRIDALSKIFEKVPEEETQDESVSKRTELLNSTNEVGDTALILASRMGHTDSVKFLLDIGASTEIENSKSNTALNEALESGQNECALSLVEHGAECNREDREFGSLLHRCIQNDICDVVKAMLSPKEVEKKAEDEGVEVQEETEANDEGKEEEKETVPRVDYDVVDKDGLTVLILAAIHGRTKLCRMLVDANCSVIVTEPKMSYTALHFCAKYNHEEIARIIIDSGYKNVNALTKGGETALFLSCSEGNDSLASYLCDVGSSITQMTAYGSTVMHEVASRNHSEVLKVLLSHGADVDLRDERDLTPLHVALFSGSPDCVRILLENGADIEARDSLDRTPLTAAAEGGHIECSDLLFRKASATS